MKEVEERTKRQAEQLDYIKDIIFKEYKEYPDDVIYIWGFLDEAYGKGYSDGHNKMYRELKEIYDTCDIWQFAKYCDETFGKDKGNVWKEVDEYE